jgi:protein TonB
MEITLSQFDDKEKPEEADYLAQTNQQGSGEEAEKSELTSPTQAEMTDVQVREASPLTQQYASPIPPTPPARTVVSTTAKATTKTPKIIEKERETEAPVAEKRSLLQRSLEIASLEAKLDEQQKIYSKRPRITRLTAASTMKTSDAYYMKAWLEKVERIGNLNYPEKAREQSIYGSLRLLVALYADGSVKEIRVMQSSGYKLLDDSAINIVRLAAPFSPFPEEVRKERDVLEIIRTWSFQKKGLSSY